MKMCNKPASAASCGCDVMLLSHMQSTMCDKPATKGSCGCEVTLLSHMGPENVR